MGTYRKIMIVVDKEMKHGAAFARGVEFAKKTGAEVLLMLADYRGALIRAHSLDKERLRKVIRGYVTIRQRWLNKEVEKLKEQGIRAQATAVWHKPAWEAIAKHALEHAPDLVIKDVEKTSAVERALFTRADWHLMRACPAPLLMVHANTQSFPKRILAAVDPNHARDKPAELNDRILDAALELGRHLDAEVHAAHAYEYVSASAFIGPEADARYFAAARQERRERFAALCKAHDIPPERMHFQEGSPAVVIADVAKRIDAGLVVLGSVARRGLRRIFMGATAEDILGVVKCDVMVLKPQGFGGSLQTELEESAAARGETAIEEEQTT